MTLSLKEIGRASISKSGLFESMARDESADIDLIMDIFVLLTCLEVRVASYKRLES